MKVRILGNWLLKQLMGYHSPQPTQMSQPRSNAPTELTPSKTTANHSAKAGWDRKIINKKIETTKGLGLKSGTLLNLTESNAYKAVVKMTEEIWQYHEVELLTFAQVAFIEILDDKSDDAYRNFLGMRSDLCLCDDKFNVIAIIEVQGTGHEYKGNDNIKEHACREIGVIFHSIYASPSDSSYKIYKSLNENLYPLIALKCNLDKLGKKPPAQITQVSTYCSFDWWVAETSTSCWKCNKETPFYSIVLGENTSRHTEQAVEEAHNIGLAYVTDIANPALEELIGISKSTYRMDTKQNKDSYYMNHCQHCGVLQDDRHITKGLGIFSKNKEMVSHKMDGIFFGHADEFVDANDFFVLMTD